MHTATRPGAGPSLTALSFAIWAGAAALLFGGRILNGDGDPARHLRHGAEMLRGGMLIRQDPFSFTRPDAPFLGFEYGSQLLLAAAERVAGLPGVVVLSALMLGLTYALLVRFLVRRGADPALAFLVTTAAAVLGSMHWVARPHLFTQLAVVLLLELLERERPAPLWLFALLFAPWANLHGGFVYGLVLIGLYAAGGIADARAGQRPIRPVLSRFTAVYTVALGATLLNPFGLALHRHVLWYLGEPFIKRNTAEFFSPDFHTAGGRVFLLLLLGVIAALALRGRRPSWTRLLVVLANVAFALLAQRNIALFGLVALPLVALHANAAWLRLPEPPNFRASFAGAVGRPTLPWMLGSAALLGVLALAGGRVGPLRLIPATFDARTFPVAAVARARAAGVDDRIFAKFTWGGYLLHAWPEQKVFIDGGTDFYGEPVMRDYLEVWTLQPGWRERLRARGVTAALLPPRSPLAGELAREPGWRVWYCDATAVLLRSGAGSSAAAPPPASASDGCGPLLAAAPAP